LVRLFEGRPEVQSIGRELYAFDGYTLDLIRGCLRNAGGEIQLRAKSFELLRYLVQNAGRLISKDELVTAVWPNVIVGDDSLAQCMSELRNALSDLDRRIIKTVPRRGYLFAVPVSIIPSETIKPVDPGRAPPEDATSLPESTLGGATRVAEPITTETSLPLPDKPSIAVLAFTNMSGDPEQEYFADGMVEEIITALSRIHWLFVIARTSSFTFKTRAVDVKQIGQELGVRYVLEGSVRKVDNRVRITALLIDALDGVHIWADHFDGTLDNVFELQDE
jgi:adenylate cyclase